MIDKEQNIIKKIFSALLTVTFITFISFSCSVKSKEPEIVSLVELENPIKMRTDENSLFITGDDNGTTIFVYSLKDFKLSAKFGEKGKGEGQFVVNEGEGVDISICEDNVLVSSFWKISFFKKDSELIKEIRGNPDTFFYKVLGDQFVGLGYLKEKETDYYTIDIYDTGLNKVKEIYRVENQYQKSKGNRVLTKLYQFEVYQDKVFIKGKNEDFFIDVFNKNGEHLYSIIQDYQRLPLLQKHKEDVYDLYRNHPNFKNFFEIFKKEIVFPEFLPAVKEFRIADGKIYAVTFYRENGKTEFYILDLNGKFRKKKMLSLKWKSILQIYPYSIKNSRLYQLIKDEKTQKWNVQISEI